MENKKYLIIVAGGKGVRMGSDLPKQFLRIHNKAVLQISIEKFLRAVPEIKVITVLPQSHIDWWREYCIENKFACPQTLVAGGITRFHSVANALAKVPDGAVVAVHDGVRPLISAECIRRLFTLAESRSAVIPVLPCYDTVKPLRDMKIIPDAELDRNEVFMAQTPQIFHSELLKEGYDQPFDTKFTDDASVLENKKIPLTYVEGERFNFKITNADDLRIAEALMSM